MSGGGGSRTGPCTALTVALLALAAVLSGCVSIPASGPVETGRTLDGSTREPRRSFNLPGPASGDGPVAVVRGFLRAAPDFSRDHSVARSFLTRDKRTTWRPDSPVVVHDAEINRLPMRVTSADLDAGASQETGQVPPGTRSAASSTAAAPDPPVAASPGSQVSVEVELPVVARIDDAGEYLPSPTGEVQLFTFHLVAEEGEWRITNPARGVAISRSDFQTTFTATPLYFRDSTGRYLVPDVRWFPVGSPPSAVVAALLEGPSSWLGPAVTTGAPSGTELSATGVRSDGETLVVDLNLRAKEAAPEQRQVLFTQLRTTLREASRTMDFLAGDVRVTVEEARFEVPLEAVDPPRPVSFGEADRRPVALDGQNRINRLNATLATPVADLPALPADADRPGVSPVGETYAVLAEGLTRLILVTPGRGAQPRLLAAPLTPPSFDVQGWVWTSPQASKGVLHALRVVTGPGGRDGRIEVAAPWLRGYQVSTLRISPEGARALVVARHQGRSVVYVAGVMRDGDGTPRALTDPPLRVARDLATVRDASWRGEDLLSVLGTRAAGAPQRVWAAQIGGETVEGILAPDVLAITAGDDPYALWAQTPAGAVYQSGAALLALPGLRWPALPG